MVDLHPIVILPFEHKFKSVTYTCSGEGLHKDGYSYDPHAEKLLPPKSPKPGNAKGIETKPAGWWRAQCAFRGLNQSGSIADLQLRLREAKAKMIPELKTAESQLNKDFKKQNKIARDSGWKCLKTAEEKAEANPEKYLSEAFPKTATGRPANLDIVILKTERRAALAAAADKMGLESVSVDAPWVGNVRPSPDRWIVIGRSRDAVWNQMREIERREARPKEDVPKVREKQTSKVGPSKMLAPPKLFESKPPGGRTKQTARKFAPSTGTHDSLFGETEAHAARPILPLPRKRQTARENAPSTAIHDDLSSDSNSHFTRPGPVTPRPGRQTARKTVPSTSNHANLFSDGEDGDDAKPPATKRARTSVGGARSISDATNSEGTWDVRGSYVIECPNIEDEWGEKDSELTLDIYVENKNGRQQMFAMFHFIVVKGIMRFERPNPISRSQNGNGKRKREDAYMDEDGDILMSDIPQYDVNGNNPNSYRESAVFLGANDKPSARLPTWQYRWRGEETGEGEIQLGSDKTLESITFNDKEKSLSGTFTCDFAGKCTFTGLKVMYRPQESRIDPEVEWADRSEAAYEDARQARWR
ncbi:f3264f75-1397-40cf-9e4f-c25dccdfe720 [Sclerotinia trifoliorum]|uniref:F3264f75-1397-40cf-9e4f-c25dccdfe720 n=1 Tax=Sclerotinia trifoliorum TaxID=28548 RepID=A0A8H2VLR8_9HELO|nr:f3264f75-1397-40cf-9e4f-c25dccdfe720 [Sclerotinia trifoliorum]